MPVRIETSLGSALDPNNDQQGLKILPKPSKYPHSYEELDANGPPLIEEDGANLEIPETKRNDREGTKETRTDTQLPSRLGDLHDFETEPPQNEIIAYHLNPDTSGDGLKTIFDQFGEILSCDVIHDSRAGTSLEYAFIEFEQEEDCEAAILKMENVVIDGCQIHVDFSRSAAKEWFKYKMDKIGGHPSTPEGHRDTEWRLRRSSSPSSSPHETTPESFGMENLVLSPEHFQRQRCGGTKVSFRETSSD